MFLFHVDFDITVGSPALMIPDIKVDYLAIKDVFVNISTKKGSPTLVEVKERCFDLIKVAATDVHQIRYCESVIRSSQTMVELARVVCFDFSNWVNCDFFEKVIAPFQPTLEDVKVQLLHYKAKLKPILLQKLECIAELQER